MSRNRYNTRYLITVWKPDGVCKHLLHTNDKDEAERVFESLTLDRKGRPPYNRVIIAELQPITGGDEEIAVTGWEYRPQA